LEERNINIPAPSNIKTIKTNEIQFVQLIVVNMLHVRNEEDNKAVRKNISIPKWLNAKAKENKINCSSLLASAIREKLGI
jgi:hypothetical protein